MENDNKKISNSQDANENHFAPVLHQSKCQSANQVQIENSFATQFAPPISPTEYHGKHFYTAQKAAKIVGVTRQTIEYWRKQNLFKEDLVTHDGKYLYEIERVMQLKSVYRRDWQSAYRKYDDDIDTPLTPPPTDKPKKMYIPENIVTEINAIAPETLLAHGVISMANDEKSFVCLECGNGEGKTGTGITPKFLDSIWKWHCFKCDHSFNNISILAIYYGLNKQTDFVEICRRACNDFGIYFPFDDMPKKTKALTKSDLIKSDILKAQDNIENLPIEARRGLSIDTYQLHKCGYIPDWQTIESRIAGILNATPTPRLIIPTGLTHYLARLTVDIASFDNVPDRAYITEKPHAGTKLPFAIDFITEKTKVIVVVEGEIDAMSLNQVLGFEYRVAIATLGATVGKDIKRTIFEKLDSIFAGKEKKPCVLVLFDNDNAGKINAPKLVEDFIQREYPATFDFLSDGDEKLDANNILVQRGDDALREVMFDIVQRSNSAWDNAIKAITDKQNEQRLCPSKLFLTQEQYQKYFRDISGTSDLDNARRLAHILKYQLGDSVRYLADCDKWANYDEKTGTWLINSNSRNTALNPQIAQAADILAANAKTSDDSKIANAYKNNRKFSPAVTTLKYNSLITISSEDLDNHKNLLNCENCVIDLETGKTYQHAPCIDFNGEMAHFSQMARAEFRPNYHNETVEKFLREIQPDEDTLHALLMWLGYAFTGECNEEKFLFMDGDGGNGKGTFTKSILYIANSYGCSFPVGAILKQKSYDVNAATTAFNMLVGKRISISEEIPANEKLDAAKIKLLSGNDPIPIRPLFEEYKVHENPTHTMFFSGNALPEIGDVHDPGIQRRLRRIQFKQNFRDNPNPNLKQQLLTPNARAGWLSLIVQHAQLWYQHGLPESDEMKQAVKVYFESQDFISDFISEHCERSRSLSIPRKDFLKRLQENYPKETRGLSDRALTSMVEKIDGISYRFGTGGKYYFFGIGWNDAQQQQVFGEDFS